MTTQSTFTNRLTKLRGILQRTSFDAVAFIPSANFYYLTGLPFHQPSSRPLVLIVPKDADPLLIVPSLEAPRLEGKMPFAVRQVCYTDAEGAESAFMAAGKWLSGMRIGVEGMKMRFMEGFYLAKHTPQARVEAAEETLAWLRIHKTPEEIAMMRRAIQISEASLAEVLPQVKIGMTERQIAKLLNEALVKHGAAEYAFDTTVLAAANSALPHGSVGETTVQRGEYLLFDYGAKLDGYSADITRTFFVGEARDELKRIYATVLEANLAGIAAAKPGASCQEVDQAARQVITNAGYGEYFIHRTGHGLGLDIHEPPYIREGNAQILEPGMVFTVEPGIYVPGIGGVRIEDDVLITPQGADVLTSFPKEARVIGT
ncbi:MAG: aminopeptidase P family protein [Anaerolineae bacterium]